ncbi:hypothetical protein DRF65_17165 [Chryseobacterium pennae]|uniref:Uncharacterized protein n=1 Tax=Chryseobacterium pennae TaxID=2258962 RepID=A0A3D9C629_9FLAO|nr:hypothetical protein DRF65_17165 [Chryseobacterium pennae]
MSALCYSIFVLYLLILFFYPKEIKFQNLTFKVRKQSIYLQQIIHYFLINQLYHFTFHNDKVNIKVIIFVPFKIKL